MERSSSPPSPGLSVDFWKFWAGQTISNLGSSFAQWAVQLLVYRVERVQRDHRALAVDVIQSQRLV